MKIVALHTDFRIYWPARLKALAKALDERGDSLEVIEIAGFGSPYSFSGVNDTSGLSWNILFPESRPEDLNGKFIKRKLFPLLDEIRPDVVISGAIAYPSGALAVQYGQKNGTKIIVFDDSKMEAVPRSRFVNYIKQAVYSGVDAMFYPAEDWIPTGHFWGFHDNQMFFGVDVVDNDFWSKPRVIQNKWGNYFVAVGRQIPKKNYFAIAEAYAQYVEKIGYEKAYNLVLIGDGPEHERIEEFVHRSGLDDKVFMLPFLSQEELPGIYQNAKALCSSSSSETWGLVINEAMCCGCPIFASYECGASNVLVKEGVNGYRFHCDDVHLLSQRMFEFTILSDRNKAEMRESSYAIIQHWGLPKFVNGAICAIDSVTNSIKRHTSLLDKIIISKWFGRYNPI